MAKIKYKRVLLKLSGEIFGGRQKYGIDPATLDVIADEIKSLKKYRIDIAIVVGGGNIFRGIAGSARGMDRATGDYMGMLATVINSLALQDALQKNGVDSRVQTAIEMRTVAEPFIRRRAMRHMEKGRVIILAAGTGNPYFSTDTAAALRAAELDAEVILKATKVDGIYDKDPINSIDAKKFKKLNYLEVLNRKLRVMDSTATSLCMDNNIPIIVFDLSKRGNMEKVVLGRDVGTIVTK